MIDADISETKCTIYVPVDERELEALRKLVGVIEMYLPKCPIDVQVAYLKVLKPRGDSGETTGQNP